MLVNATDMLNKAREGKYAVGHFNINNLEWAKSILLTAQEMNAPVILGVSEGAGKYMGGFKVVADMVKALTDSMEITVPVALHLDHGTYEGCYKCIKAGFSSIMFDGSHYPIAENVEKTKELVAITKALGMSLEAEVGAIGGEEDGVIAVKAKVGNMPLVLHGGTGIPEDMIKKAISLGVAKINVNTECQLAFAAATRKYIEEGKDLEGKGFDPRKLLSPGTEAIKQTVREKITLFGSAGKA